MQSTQTAAREHSVRRTNLRNRIDIFRIIEQKGIWIMFQSLDLYGAYLTNGESAGILLNAKHPPNLQRFTAAHEYGHAVMQHGSRFDSEEQILPQRRRYNEQEVEAQTFAAHFLMPLELVNATLRRRGLPLKPGHITAQEAYQMSLDMGVSYAALINHLVTLKKVSQEVGYALQHIQPREIKAQIAGGMRPQNSWADVWVFNERDTGRMVTVYEHDELHIYLPEIPEENAPWSVSEKTSASNMAITLINNDLEMSTRSEQYGGEQFIYLRHIVFRANLPSLPQIELYRQSKGQVPFMDAFHLHVHILPRQKQGLSEQQIPLL
jgi:Zn-dependent peptidase ImmA (M78 family)